MTRNQKRWAQIIRRFRGRRIGVLGDFMLDELLRGEATRISPEAPVPVVLMKDAGHHECFPGGAGNVVANLRALGGKPLPFGAIGADENGKRLLALLKARGIPRDSLVVERGRITPRKVRIVAHQHQLLRLDFEQPAEISSRTAQALVRKLARTISRLNALIISDYQKGSVTTELANHAISLCRQRRIPVFVDPKPEHPEICRHATVATPNLHEAEIMLGPMRTRQELLEGGRRLLSQLGCANLLITRGSGGMALFQSDGSTHEIAGVARPVYDVTGAGDTVLAVLALAYCSGATLQEAAEIANLAGGCVVLKFGTAEITSQELLAATERASESN
jgi:D-glycero-beta-D-manno-heptose-7-phosphate kinase